MAQRSGVSILQRFEALPIIIVFVLLLLLFMYRAPEVFLAPYIYTTFLSTLPPLILLAAGLTFVIGAGEIDLSFPSIIAVGARAALPIPTKLKWSATTPPGWSRKPEAR